MTTLKLLCAMCAVLLLPMLAHAGDLSTAGAISGMGQALGNSFSTMQQG